MNAEFLCGASAAACFGMLGGGKERKKEAGLCDSHLREQSVLLPVGLSGCERH